MKSFKALQKHREAIWELYGANWKFRGENSGYCGVDSEHLGANLERQGANLEPNGNTSEIREATLELGVSTAGPIRSFRKHFAEWIWSSTKQTRSSTGIIWSAT